MRTARAASPPEMGPLPSSVVPSRKSTLPVAVTGETEAVSTMRPALLGFGLLLRLTLVAEGWGVLLPWKLASPP